MRSMIRVAELQGHGNPSQHLVAAENRQSFEQPNADFDAGDRHTQGMDQFAGFMPRSPQKLWSAVSKVGASNGCADLSTSTNPQQIGRP